MSPSQFLLPSQPRHYPNTPLASPGVVEGFLISQPNADAQKFNLVVPPSAGPRQPYFNMAGGGADHALPDQPNYAQHPQYNYTQQPSPTQFFQPNSSYAAYDAYYGQRDIPPYYQTQPSGFEAHLDRVFTPPQHQHFHEQFPQIYEPFTQQPLAPQPQSDLTPQHLQQVPNMYKHNRTGSMASTISNSSNRTFVPSQPDLRFPPGLGMAR